MEILTTETPVVAKTKELCTTIVDQPEFKEMIASVEAFMMNPGSQQLLECVREMQAQLQQKQHSGQELTAEDIAGFESARDELLADSVAKGFLDAQEQMHEVQSTVTRYVTKTLEIGRVPEEVDFESCACGSGGCGC